MKGVTMKVKELIENASPMLNFVVCNQESHNIPFGIDPENEFPLAISKSRIKGEFAYVLEWEVQLWWYDYLTKCIWIDARVPVQSMREVVENFFDYTDSLGIGELL